MGLFDGHSSTADAARRFGLPVLLGVDARGMAETLAAVVHGLTTYDPRLAFAGVIANNVGSPGHTRYLAEAMQGLPVGLAGGIPRDERMALPERHLGLFRAGEVADLDERLDAAAQALAEAGAVPELPELAIPEAPYPTPGPHLAGRRIAVARDAAFAFCYPANRRLLREMGAELVDFSPVAGEGLPAADAVYLPGGYPELHAESLAANRTLWRQLAAHVDGGGAVLAECGGMLPLFEVLEDQSGTAHAVAGLLPGRVRLEERLQGLGMQALDLGSGQLRGHTFHYTQVESGPEPWGQAVRQRGERPGEAVYRHGGLTASYLHFHFASHPAAAAALLGGAVEPA
jgi:cobyrinic acid a,c-diamide synthase